MKVQSACLIFSVFVGITCAATSPPDIPPDKISWEADDLSWAAPVTKKPTTGLRMGRFKVTYEKTRLSDVMSVAGGEIAAHGDGAEYILWLCYTIDNSKQRQRLWIISGGEIGGPDHEITDITAQMTKDGPSRDCPELARELQPVSFNNGLWLGVPESRATSLFREAPASRGLWRATYYKHKLPGDCQLGNSLVWQVVDGVINTINAGQISSC